MVTRFVKWAFPRSVNRIKGEVEEGIHAMYRQLGVQLEYVIPKHDLPYQPLVEGKAPDNCKLKMIARVKVGELKELQVW